MKAYTSFWSYPSLLAISKENKNSSTIEKIKPYENTIEFADKMKIIFELYEMSFNSFKTFYKEPQIITDSLGAFLFKKYTKINPAFIKILIDESPNKYYPLWNFGKLLTYQMISGHGNPVLFFDLDVILDQALPKDFIKNSIFCYDDICKNDVLNWGIEEFINHIKINFNVCNNLMFLDKTSLLKKALTIKGSCSQRKIENEDISTPIPNCAILGGSRPDIIYYIYSEILKNIYCEDNASYWTTESSFGFQKPCVAEQLFLGLLCMDLKTKNKDIETNYAYDKDCTIMNFLNLYPDKENIKIKHVGWHKKFLGKKKLPLIIDEIDYWK